MRTLQGWRCVISGWTSAVSTRSRWSIWQPSDPCPSPSLRPTPPEAGHSSNHSHLRPSYYTHQRHQHSHPAWIVVPDATWSQAHHPGSFICLTFDLGQWKLAKFEISQSEPRGHRGQKMNTSYALVHPGHYNHQSAQPVSFKSLNITHSVNTFNFYWSAWEGLVAVVVLSGHRTGIALEKHLNIRLPQEFPCG